MRPTYHTQPLIDEPLPDSQPSSAGVNESLDRRMHRLEEQYCSIQKSMDEVRSMVTKLSQESFKIKGSQYEVCCIFLEAEHRLSCV